jgi:hypothetical protein
MSVKKTAGVPKEDTQTEQSQIKVQSLTAALCDRNYFAYVENCSIFLAASHVKIMNGESHPFFKHIP